MPKPASRSSAPPPKPGAPDSESPLSAESFVQLDGEKFARNMLRLGVQAQELLGEFLNRDKSGGKASFDPLNIMGAFLALTKAMGEDRKTLAAAQLGLWQDWMGLWENTARRVLGGQAPLNVQPAPGDRRFRDNEWQRNEIFDFLKQSYLLAAKAAQETVAKLPGIPEPERKRVEFYTRQLADALAPTNFPLTNPEVVRATLKSNGENLVRGMANLLDDLRRGRGTLSIRRSADAFTLGGNIATAPGKVVFRNELMELLQFAPATGKVYQRPLLIFPPWINKYYILDLRPENSLIRWLVGRGYSVFVVSWVNPDARLAQKGLEDYMREGIFAALDAVKKSTGISDPNCVGYCIGGTLLAATLAYMAASGKTSPGGCRIHSATFWAAQTDFSEAGELSVFVDDAQLEALAERIKASGGVLDGSKMAATFSMLRANDLIWSFVINNYFLGKQPLPFDLLYWNSDATRMPEKLHLSYLRQCYHDNALARGKMAMAGVRLDLSKVKLPVYLQAAKEDHIAPANSVFKGLRLFGGPVRFVLAGSGHIAGVINPPAAKKYQYWTSTAKAPATLDAWRAAAAEHQGSWWPDWDKWLSKLSGPKVAARKPGGGKLKVLGDAPGSYVRVKAQ